MSFTVSNRFPRYKEYKPQLPVWCVTPNAGRVIHRFFDTSPFSPSGRYLALTRLPYEDRMFAPGDRGEVVVIDLAEGTEKTVAETCGWDTQLGAQVQWGADDSQLLFNDVEAETWIPYCVVLDPATGRRRDLDGPVYMAARDGSRIASPCLRRTGLTQAGYGVIVPDRFIPRNTGAPADDGIYETDTLLGTSRLLVSLADIVTSIPELQDRREYPGGGWYGFHVKYNPQGSRLMFVVRWRPDDGSTIKANLVTMDAEGRNIRLAIPYAEWRKHGHHPDWCPDGDHVMMNLKLDGETMRFVQAQYDGTGLEAMSTAVEGSGHPTLHPNGIHILTDAYLHEPCSFKDGTVPIRFIDLRHGTGRMIARINRDPDFPGALGEWRVDPHPAWDRSFTRVAFNGWGHGTRRVYVADLAGWL